MLGGFEDYLVTKVGLDKKYISYYLRWVSYCYSFLDQPDNSLLTSDQVQSYLNNMSKTREDWQVKQAEAALRHYGYYLSADTGDAIGAGTEQDADKTLWTALEKKASDHLRLRHRSYSTEKPYIGWLRAFRGFVGKTAPADLSVKDMQNFLSFLAVERHVAQATQRRFYEEGGL